MDISDLVPVTAMTQGDTLAVTVSLLDYPATAYTLAYCLKVVNQVPTIITSTPSGVQHKITIPGTTSAAWVPGTYLLVAYVVAIVGGARLTLGGTDFTVFEDLTGTTAAYDPRSPNKVILDQIDAVLAKITTDAIADYTIGGRSVRLDKAGLLKMRQHYAVKVRKESGRKTGRLIGYGFGGR